MIHTQIRGNTSDSSDGCGGVCAWDAHGSLTGVVIEDNDAHDVGGGIKFESDDGDVLMVTDSTIRNNGSNVGGGVYVRGGTVHLNNSALTDNRAGFHGGGIYARSYITAGDTTVWVERGTWIGQAGHGNVANAAPSSSTGLGGGIYSEAIVRISDSTVEGNIGDGIVNSSVGSLYIQNSIVRGNSLGGIYSSSFPTIGTVQISNSTIQGNTQAGIYVSNADLFVIGSLIDGNSGGGLQQNRGTLNFSYSTVSGNSVLGIGGGIGAMDLTSADISHSTISGNSAGSNGGGLYLSARSGTVRNVTISGNHADAGAGGGMVAGGDSITLNNVTIAQNSAYGSGGLLGDERLTIKNSIIAGNTPYNCGAVEPYVSGGHNLDDGTTCGLSGPGDLSGVAAMLGPLQDNGGSSLTHALLVDSPAIDAGNDATCLPLDQRNVVRPQGAHCDMGAFEMISASATPTPTRTPYPTDTATAAILPTHTPTATGTSAKVVFDPVTFSAGQIFQGGKSCTPRDVTVRVRVSPPEAVASVGLFFRLEAKQGGQSTPWGEGLKMTPQGNGWYQLTISSGDLLNIMNWQSDAWVEFQFVANNINGQPFAWSAVYRNVTLSPCYK